MELKATNLMLWLPKNNKSLWLRVMFRITVESLSGGGVNFYKDAQYPVNIVWRISVTFYILLSVL